MSKKEALYMGVCAAAVVAIMGLFSTENVRQRAAAGQDIASTTSFTQEASTSIPTVGPAYLYPDHVTTPGALNPDVTQDTIATTICAGAKVWSTKSIRPPVSYTNAIKVNDLKDYDTRFATTTSMADGELDHLIPIELGGNPTDTENLWFEPYHTQVDGVEVGAHQKDMLENYLKKQVCAGSMTLQVAQTIISEDWYQVYKVISSSSAVQGTLDSTDEEEN